MTALWLALLLGVSIWTFSLPVSANDENDVVNYLLNISSKNSRPLKKSSDVMETTFDLGIKSFAIDEPTQTLTVIAYEMHFWKDQIMVWEPKEYGGVNAVALDKKDIWTPDITLFNSATGGDVEYGQGQVHLDASGQINFVRSSNSKVICDGDSLRFPFDTLNCTLIFGSWLYSGEKLDVSLSSETLDLHDIKLNPLWTLKSAKVKKVTKVYPCCPEPYYSFEYNIEFLRASGHYVQVLLVPAFLLSILTILIFLLPTHSSERITLGVLLFCSFFVLLVYTSSLVTVWTNLPYFVIFLIFNLFVITLFTFLHSVIIKMAVSDNGTQEVPKIVRTVMFEILARIFCMKSIVERNRSRHLVVPAFQFTPEGGNYNKLMLSSSEKQPLDPVAPKVYPIDDLPGGGEPTGQRTLESDVASIRALTACLGQKMKDGERDKKFSREWRDLAAVVNRLFFVIYKVVVIIAIGVVYIQISDE